MLIKARPQRARGESIDSNIACAVFKSLLSKAKYLGGIELVPVPRNTAYTTDAGATEVQASVLEQMIIDKTFIIPNECTDLTLC